MNWLRYVLLAVCILSALAGYRKGAGPDSAVHGVPDSGDRTGDLDESVCNGCAE